MLEILDLPTIADWEIRARARLAREVAATVSRYDNDPMASRLGELNLRDLLGEVQTLAEEVDRVAQRRLMGNEP